MVHRMIIDIWPSSPELGSLACTSICLGDLMKKHLKLVEGCVFVVRKQPKACLGGHYKLNKNSTLSACTNRILDREVMCLQLRVTYLGWLQSKICSQFVSL
jgi:hypothetical protein